MEQDLKILVLGALLHDIGKFAQRARRPYSENMQGDYLTSYKGKPGHWHTLYTDHFIEHDLPLPSELADDKTRGRIVRVASAHHRPDEDSLMEMCICAADRLSAGFDRLPDEPVDDSTGFRESRLVSIFDEIELLRHTFQPPGNAFYKLAPLTAGSDAIFPCAGKPAGPADEYEGFFDAFLSDLQSLGTDLDFRFYLAGLMSILEKYTWCIPSSSYKTLSDVSLFDHGFSAAGIAQALFIHHKASGAPLTWNDTAEKCVLAAGDLSGIQNYIFAVSRDRARGVSKIFRARSFYLQAAAQSVLIDIQRRLGLYPVCTLAASGGKFILLLPNTDDVRSRLAEIEAETQFWFLEKFKGELTLNFSRPVPLAHGDFVRERFQAKIEAVNEALEKSKYGKLRAVFKKDIAVISKGYDEREGGNCAICGIHEADPESSKSHARRESLDAGAEMPVCRDCFDQIHAIGAKLPKTRYLTYGETGDIALFGGVRLKLSEKPPENLSNVFRVDNLTDEGGFSRVRLARHLPQITNEELKDERWFELFDSEMEPDYTIAADQPKTFSMIAHKSKKEDGNGKLKGRSLLAFFKADVDNLGLIFSMGLREKMSSARFSALSRMLDIFFSEYLTELARKEYPDIYVVFAGGDDMFLTGPWWQVIRFAITLRKKLSAFCAGNPDITLSAGILPAKARLPVRKAVEMVEAHLERAKACKEGDHVKDAVCFLKDVLIWGELEELMAMGERFDKAVEEKKRTNFSTAFLFRLLTYYRMYKKFTEEKMISFGNYLALAHYDIGRNIIAKGQNNQEEVDMLHKIFSVGVKDRPALDKLNVPLFYAINLNRETK